MIILLLAWILSQPQGKPKNATIVVAPAMVSLPVGTAQQFTATTTGTTKLPTWTATGGTITQSGRFVAGSSPGIYFVTATLPANVRSSATVQITSVVDTTAPTMPTNLIASAVGQTSLTLTWGASTDDVGVVKYEVWMTNVLMQVVTIGTTASFVSLTCQATYSFDVNAVDAAGNRSAKANRTLQTSDCDPPPPVVTATTLFFTPSTDYATNVTSNSVELRRSGEEVTVTPVGVRNLGKPAPVNNEVSVDISTLVDPLPTGSYYAIVVAIGPGGATPSSPSPVFSK